MFAPENSLDKNYATEMEGRISSSLAAAQAKLAAARQSEDSKAEVDANFVICESGKISEIQVTGEEYFFTESQFDSLFNLAKKGISEIIQKQKKLLSNEL